MKNRIRKIISRIREELYLLRDLSASNPTVMRFRLKLFGFHPFLSQHFFKIILFVIVFFSFYISFYLFVFGAPISFPDHTLITIDKGTGLSQTSHILEKNKIIKSSIWFKILVFLSGGQNKIIAGDYYFGDRTSMFEVMRKIRSGDFGLIANRITIPEGSSSAEIADILANELFNFNKEDFIKIVEDNGYEGTLFPDTYFFTPNTKIDDIIFTMRENFVRQIKRYEEDIIKSGKNIDDIIKMASIVEKEANHKIETKRIVAGILWKRIKLNMPLQVDAPFRYYNGKHSYTLTKDDLKEEHPYNTYTSKGLPPTAISNPGIDSVRATIAPTNTEYLFFMSDKSGNVYYAKDFNGHQRNRERYLR